MRSRKSFVDLSFIEAMRRVFWSALWLLIVFGVVAIVAKACDA